MQCPVCQDTHEPERLGVAKEVTGLKSDIQAQGCFCPTLELWILKSSEVYKESAGIVTLKPSDVTLLEPKEDRTGASDERRS